MTLFLWSLVTFFKPSENTAVTFPIPKGNAGFLIGRGGETLRALEEEFKLHIHVEKIPTADMQRIVVIVGDNATAVYSARNKILSLVGN